MAKIGRPKKRAADKASILVALRLTQTEHKSLKQAASKAGHSSLSDYIRLKLQLRGTK